MAAEQIGPYRIVGTLGRGGMGVVYHGVNVDTDEPAAIKLLPEALASEEGFRHRFKGEIDTLLKLYHPNIVQLFGYGEQDGALFYAMELVLGSSLEEELRRGRRFDWRETAEIGIQVCRALRHAHDRGVIHRDIKPANLLLAKTGTVKLSDFGIARLFGNTRITVAGSVLGTADYMAPEQASAGAIGPRSDLYSLGGVLFALLAGRGPFKASSVVEMLDKHRSEPAEPVNRFADNVPEELDQIIAQLLEKDPDKRISNATLLARRLGAMLQALSLRPELFDRPQPSVNSPGPVRSSPMSGEEPLPETVIARESAAGLLVSGGVSGTFDPRQLTRLSANAAGHRPALADDLPETEIGSGSHSPARPDRASQQQATTTRTELPKQSRFVSIGEEDLDPVEAEDRPHALISWQTWILVAALAVVGAVVWYLLRPFTAEALYAKILRLTPEQGSDSWDPAEPYIEEFLRRFPADVHAELVRGYRSRIQLAKLERKLEHPKKTLLPIEQEYIEAKHYAWLSPDRGLAKFQALVNLNRDQAGNPLIGCCVELARRQIEHLRKQVETANAQSLKQIQERLVAADKIRKKDPVAARAIWQAIVEFYGDRAWAHDAVERAQKALATKDSTEAKAN